MIKGSLNLCSVFVLLSIIFATCDDTTISYEIEEHNNKLTNLQERFDLTPSVIDGNVTVLQHGLEGNKTNCAENISVQIKESNRKLEDKIDLHDAKLYVIECKLNTFATRVSNNISKYAENVTVQMQELNRKFEDRENLHDTKLNVLEGKLNGLATTVSNNITKYAENVTVQMQELNRKFEDRENLHDTKLNVLEGKLNGLATTVSNNITKYAENVTVQFQNLNRKLNNVQNKIDSHDAKMNALESKINALATTVEKLIGDMRELSVKQLSSCKDAFSYRLLNGGNGIYNIKLNSYSSPFDVYCMIDPKGGLPWTVVQRRVDDTVDFSRNWSEYKRGFGDLKNNFFIGLDHLHFLTTKGEPQELWVMLTDTDGISAHAYYSWFAIDDEADKYRLYGLGVYSGDAGDSLSDHRSRKFSTFDSDNDLFFFGNCALDLRSAWWYKSCSRGDLNGLYWLSFREQRLKYVHMAIRPARK